MFLGDISRPWFERNYRAYADAMISYGLAPMLTSISDAESYFEIGSRGAEQILTSGQPVTAIFAANDEIAGAVMQTLTRRGVSIPGQISVVGFDDNPNSIQFEPQLTTVRVPKEELGAECARFLFEKIANPEMATGARIIPTKLIVRGSCSKPPTSL
jgi:LacI family transcriptional regulator